MFFKPNDMENKIMKIELGDSIKDKVRISVSKSVKWSMRISESHLLQKGWGSIRTPINNLIIWRIII